MEYEVSIINENGITASNADSILELVQSEDFKKYNYVVTCVNYKDAKKDVAALKKQIDNAKRKRIDYESSMLEQWKPIKDKLMQAEKIVASYEENLRKGIKEVDDAEKEEKKAIIEVYFDEVVAELPFKLPFEKIFNEKWLNKSCKETDWQKDVMYLVNHYQSEFNILESVCEDKELIAKLYEKDFNYTEALDTYKIVMAERLVDDSIEEETLEEYEEVVEMVTLKGSKDKIEYFIKAMVDAGIEVAKV